MRTTLCLVQYVSVVTKMMTMTTMLGYIDFLQINYWYIVHSKVGRYLLDVVVVVVVVDFDRMVLLSQNDIVTMKVHRRMKMLQHGRL